MALFCVLNKAVLASEYVDLTGLSCGTVSSAVQGDFNF